MAKEKEVKPKAEHKPNVRYSRRIPSGVKQRGVEGDEPLDVDSEDDMQHALDEIETQIDENAKQHADEVNAVVQNATGLTFATTKKRTSSYEDHGNKVKKPKSYTDEDE